MVTTRSNYRDMLPKIEILVENNSQVPGRLSRFGVHTVFLALLFMTHQEDGIV